jgi:hypothetical protein
MFISVILIGQDGWTDTAESLEVERMTSAYGFLKPWWKGVSFFHRDGTRYEVLTATPSRRLPPMAKLLAATIYNPRFTVQYEFRSVGPYEIDDLRQAVADAIDRDDDILTQFHEADELKERLAEVKTFDGVLKLLRFAQTDPH